MRPRLYSITFMLTTILLVGSVVVSILVMSAGQPSPPPCYGSEDASQTCIRQILRYVSLADAKSLSFWTTEAGILIILVPLVAIVTLALEGLRMKTLGFSVFAAGSYFFSTFALIDLLQEGGPLTDSLSDWARHVSNLRGVQSSLLSARNGFGLVACLSFIALLGGFYLYSRSVRGALRVGALAVIIFELGLWVSSPPMMSSHIVNLLTGFPSVVVSNWTALIFGVALLVSTFLMKRIPE